MGPVALIRSWVPDQKRLEEELLAAVLGRKNIEPRFSRSMLVKGDKPDF